MDIGRGWGGGGGGGGEGSDKLVTFFVCFSKNRPLADSFIESQCPSIYLYICLSPFHVIFLRVIR